MSKTDLKQNFATRISFHNALPNIIRVQFIFSSPLESFSAFKIILKLVYFFSRC